MDIKRVADRIANKHLSRNPFQIAEDMGYIVIRTPLSGIRGYYQHVLRNHIIYVSSEIPEHEQVWVCAHELGHATMHGGLNRLFMDAKTLMVSNKYEIEANRFAAFLLLGDDMIAGYFVNRYTAAQISSETGIEESIVSYRLDAYWKENEKSR